MRPVSRAKRIRSLIDDSGYGRKEAAALVGAGFSELPASAPNVVTCLYCGRVTGSSTSPGRVVVGLCCRRRPDRSERREVIAGERPWARPLWFFANKAGAMSDEKAARAQDAWDRWQNWVRAFNNAHLGCSCSPEEIANGHKRKLRCLPECFVIQREAALAALPASDRTAWEDYRRDLATAAL